MVHKAQLKTEYADDQNGMPQGIDVKFYTGTNHSDESFTAQATVVESESPSRYRQISHKPHWPTQRSYFTANCLFMYQVTSVYRGLQLVRFVHESCPSLGRQYKILKWIDSVVKKITLLDARTTFIYIL